MHVAVASWVVFLFFYRKAIFIIEENHLITHKITRHQQTMMYGMARR